MGDEHITAREFDGFAQSLRGSVDMVLGRVNEVSVEVKGLYTNQLEELRIMGELGGSLKAVNEKLATHEDAIKSLRAESASRHQNGIGWYMQAKLVVLAAVIAALFSKYYK